MRLLLHATATRTMREHVSAATVLPRACFCCYCHEHASTDTAICHEHASTDTAICHEHVSAATVVSITALTSVLLLL